MDNPQRLRMVYSRAQALTSNSVFQEEESGLQQSLFPRPKAGMVVFIQIPQVGEAEFVNVIVNAQPAYVFDMRLAPRFDIGALNRSSVFELFLKSRTKYVDATAVLMSGHEKERVLQKISDALSNKDADMMRPIVFLLGGVASSAASNEEIISLLCAEGKKPSEILTLPA